MGDPGFLQWCSDWVGPGLLHFCPSYMADCYVCSYRCIMLTGVICSRIRFNGFLLTVCLLLCLIVYIASAVTIVCFLLCLIVYIAGAVMLVFIT